MKTTTLGELGRQLPVGILGSDRSLQKSFTLRPFRLKEERELGALKEKGGMNLGRYVSNILAVMCEEVGGEKLDGLKPAQRLLKFSGMWMADVLYMYVYLRTEAMGEEMKVRVPCAKCKESFEVPCDLRDLDVKVCDDPKELLKEVKLRSGFTLKGEVRKDITVQPVRWSVFESKSTKDMGALHAEVVRNAICGVAGIPDSEFGPLPDSVLNEITKRDSTTIQKTVDDNSPGPMMAVQATCPTCETNWVGPIDWGYDNFFGHSSL